MNILPAKIARLAHDAVQKGEMAVFALRHRGEVGEVGESIALLWQMVVQGGMRIETVAAGAPVIATVVQLDGDIFTLVNENVLSWPPERQVDLHANHAHDLRQALQQLVRLAALRHTIIAVLNSSFVLLQTFVVTSFAANVINDWDGESIGGPLRIAVQYLFSYSEAVALVLLLIRWRLSWLIQGLFRLCTHQAAQQWREDTKTTLLRLGASRP